MALSWLLSFAKTILVVDDSDAAKSEMKREEARGKAGEVGFQMPLHYPRYVRSDYEKMEEWRIDFLLRQYGLESSGDLDEKRNFAMGAFLWD